MDPDSSWGTLQLHLRAAKTARDAGDHDKALEHIDAALAVDPDFIAARMLRETLTNGAGRSPSVPAPPPPPLSEATVKYASLEARARQKRIDQRIGVARSAIVARKFDEATAALDELTELQPGSPEIARLAAGLKSAREAARRRRLTWPVGLTAAAVGALLGAFAARAPVTPLGSPRLAAVLPARPLAIFADRIESPAPPALKTAESELDQTPTVARDVTIEREPPVPAPSRPEIARVDAPAPRAVARVAPEPTPADRLESPVAVAPPEPVPVAPATIAPATSGAAPAIDDTALIREALQRYRRAYNGLDARLAHAVYPGVDEAALAHAFEGLHSQSLEFDACTLEAQGDSARAVCRGSARYVPKVGSRASRAEPRVWTFRLTKNNGDWTISSAWTDR